MYIALLLRLLLCLCAVRSKKVYDFSGQKGHRGYVDDPREDADLVSGYPSNPVEDEFLVARITPHVMPKAPRKNALVTWDSVAVTKLGNFVHKNRILHQPVVYFYGWEKEYYTLVFIHPDIPFNDTAYRNWRPWVVGNIPGLCSIHKGDVLYPYRMSAEPLKAGIQRHVFVIYKQLGKIKFLDEDRGKLSLMPVKFNLSDFVEKYDLGDPDFGNFIYSED